MKTLIVVALLTSLTSLAMAGDRDHRGPKGDKNLFEHMDRDKDGFITIEEHDAALAEMIERRREHFAEMDSDGDGAISKAEADQARKAKRAEYKAKRAERKDRHIERREKYRND